MLPYYVLFILFIRAPIFEVGDRCLLYALDSNRVNIKIDFPAIEFYNLDIFSVGNLYAKISVEVDGTLLVGDPCCLKEAVLKRDKRVFERSFKLCFNEGLPAFWGINFSTSKVCFREFWLEFDRLIHNMDISISVPFFRKSFLFGLFRYSKEPGIHIVYPKLILKSRYVSNNVLYIKGTPKKLPSKMLYFDIRIPLED